MQHQNKHTYLDDTLDVAVTLGVVERTELGGSLAVLGVGREHGPGTLTLRANNTTHLMLGLEVTADTTKKHFRSDGQSFGGGERIPLGAAAELRMCANCGAFLGVHMNFRKQVQHYNSLQHQNTHIPIPTTQSSGPRNSHKKAAHPANNARTACRPVPGINGAKWAAQMAAILGRIFRILCRNTTRTTRRLN